MKCLDNVINYTENITIPVAFRSVKYKFSSRILFLLMEQSSQCGSWRLKDLQNYTELYEVNWTAYHSYYV